MRSVGWGVVALALLAGAATAEAQPPSSKGASDGWWASLFGSKPKDDPKAAAPKPPSPEEQVRELERLQKAFDRRDAVCRRLLEIAAARDDAALRDEADRLQQAAFALYTRQTQGLKLQAPPERPRPAQDEGAVTLPQPTREMMQPLPARNRPMDADVTLPSRSGEDLR